MALAVASDGSVWKWGSSGLGVEATITPTQVAGLTNIRSIASGGDSALALDVNGRVWSWGANEHGQLGDGTTTTRLLPAMIQGLENAVAIAMKGENAMALLADGTVWEWGAPLYLRRR